MAIWNGVKRTYGVYGGDTFGAVGLKMIVGGVNVLWKEILVTCKKCGDVVEEQDGREFHGQKLCEDCYIDALSPGKACDPWAVYLDVVSISP